MQIGLALLMNTCLNVSIKSVCVNIVYSYWHRVLVTSYIYSDIKQLDIVVDKSSSIIVILYISVDAACSKFSVTAGYVRWLRVK